MYKRHFRSHERTHVKGPANILNGKLPKLAQSIFRRLKMDRQFWKFALQLKWKYDEVRNDKITIIGEKDIQVLAYTIIKQRATSYNGQSRTLVWRDTSGKLTLFWFARPLSGWSYVNRLFTWRHRQSTEIWLWTQNAAKGPNSVGSICYGSVVSGGPQVPIFVQRPGTSHRHHNHATTMPYYFSRGVTPQYI